MEERARRQQSTYAAITRVYSPTRGSSAYAYAPAEAEEWQQEEAPSRQTQQRPRQQDGVQQRPQPREELSSGTKVAMVLAIMVFAAALLAVIGRYNSISREYLEVNALNRSIEEAQLRISQLNVELQCAVNIQEAQEAANRMGLTYPDAGQLVRAGDPLVLPQQAPDLPEQDPEPLPGEE